MKRNLRHARTAAIALVTTLLVFLIVSVVLHERAVADPSQPAPGRVATALRRAGLDPHALAAAGLSASQAADVVQRVRQHLVDHPGEVASADETVADLRRASDALKRIIQSGRASHEDMAAYAAAKSQLSLAEMAQETVLNDVFWGGTSQLSTAQREIINRIRGNRRWSLPVQFAVLDRSESQWVELRDALSAERSAIESDEQPDPEVVTVLQGARSNPAVSVAAGNIDANLDLIRTAWREAVGL
jgi:hypothetical protein